MHLTEAEFQVTKIQEKTSVMHNGEKKTDKMWLLNIMENAFYLVDIFTATGE